MRMNNVVYMVGELIHDSHYLNSLTFKNLGLYSEADWQKPYNMVRHDICSSDTMWNKN